MKERLFWVVVVFALVFTLLVYANGCKRPVVKAAVAPAVPVACPEGYREMAAFPAIAGDKADHGLILVPYRDRNTDVQMNLLCAQDAALPDPRINKPVSSSIPESK